MSDGAHFDILHDLLASLLQTLHRGVFRLSCLLADAFRLGLVEKRGFC